METNNGLADQLLRTMAQADRKRQRLEERGAPRGAEETSEVIASRAELMQMMMLGAEVYDLSRFGNDGNSLNLTHLQLLDGVNFHKPDDFPLRQDYVASAVSEGIQRGTINILAQLAPDHITHEADRRANFYPWPRDIIQRRLDT